MQTHTFPCMVSDDITRTRAPASLVASFEKISAAILAGLEFVSTNYLPPGDQFED